MNTLSTFGYLKLTRFSQPACDREIYRLIKKFRYRSFVEVGLGDGQRCKNILQVAQRFSGSNLRYTGVDLFDAREDSSQQPLRLIDMHRVLKAMDLKSQLVPGDLASAIARIANSHLRTDLLIVSAGYSDEASLNQALPYFPRMLHSGSLLLLQREANQEFEHCNRLDIERWVEKISQSEERRRAA